MTCLAGATCDAMDAGACVGGGGTGGGGGGFPGLDGGGLPGFCDVSDPTTCPTGQCCDGVSGSLGFCVGDGDECALSPVPLLCGLVITCTCNGAMQACE